MRCIYYYCCCLFVTCLLLKGAVHCVGSRKSVAGADAAVLALLYDTWYVSCTQSFEFCRPRYDPQIPSCSDCVSTVVVSSYCPLVFFAFWGGVGGRVVCLCCSCDILRRVGCFDRCKSALPAGGGNRSLFWLWNRVRKCLAYHGV